MPLGGSLRVSLGVSLAPATTTPSARHDGCPKRARRREHAMVADQVGSRLRHQRGEFRDEVLGLEDDVRGAVPIRRL